MQVSATSSRSKSGRQPPELLRLAGTQLVPGLGTDWFCRTFVKAGTGITQLSDSINCFHPPL